jgi:hypothetical protein
MGSARFTGALIVGGLPANPKSTRALVTPARSVEKVTASTVGTVARVWFTVNVHVAMPPAPACAPPAPLDPPNVRLHDLRHSFASFAAAQGASLPMIGKLLGHSQAQTTQRYAHLVADPLRNVAETVGAHLAPALSSLASRKLATPGEEGEQGV